MSKRARITLDIDPEPESGPATTVNPEVEKKPQPKPKAAAAAESKLKPDSISEPPGQTKVGSSPDEARIQSEAPTAAQTHFETAAPPAGGVKLGTVIKVALVGLVVVSAILWLKRKP